jgi:hypothetical protein
LSKNNHNYITNLPLFAHKFTSFEATSPIFTAPLFLLNKKLLHTNWYENAKFTLKLLHTNWYVFAHKFTSFEATSPYLSAFQLYNYKLIKINKNLLHTNWYVFAHKLVGFCTHIGMLLHTNWYKKTLQAPIYRLFKLLNIYIYIKYLKRKINKKKMK